MGQLSRESNPPAGKLASPDPQYSVDAAGTAYERQQGKYGASFVTLYGANGQPISSVNPLEVQLNGSNSQPVITVITNTPLAAGATYNQPFQDYQAELGVYAIGYDIIASTPTEITFYGSPDGVTAITELVIVVPPNVSAPIRAFAPHSRYGKIRVKNLSTTNQTKLEVREIRWNRRMPFPQNQYALLAYGLQIRDIIGHTYASNPDALYYFNRTIQGGGKQPIYVNNGLDQELSVTIMIGPDYKLPVDLVAQIGTKKIPAGTRAVITNQDFPGLDVPCEVLRANMQCTVAPTTGAVYAAVDNTAGGAV